MIDEALSGTLVRGGVSLGDPFEDALVRGDGRAARVAAMRRLGAALARFESACAAGMTSRDMDALSRGYGVLGGLAGDMEKDSGAVEVTGLEELRSALAAPAGGRRALRAVPVSSPVVVSDAEFVVEGPEVEWGSLKSWAGPVFASKEGAREVLEMLRQGATLPMIREIHDWVTPVMVRDCRDRWSRQFGKGMEPPPMSIRKRGGWYRGPHRERFLEDGAVD